MPRSVKDFKQLLLFKIEVKLGASGNFEALLGPLASVNCVGNTSRMSSLISSSSVYFATATEDLANTRYAAVDRPRTAFAAARITSTTKSGLESIGTWLLSAS
jgi:hypothetical protein